MESELICYIAHVDSIMKRKIQVSKICKFENRSGIQRWTFQGNHIEERKVKSNK